MSLTLQRKDELIQQHHHAHSEWNVDLYGLIASIEAESVKEINDNQKYMKDQQTVISELQTEIDALKKDSERLDYLDGNVRFKMGWYVGEAPVGNICVSSVIQPSGRTTRIREAIDASMALQKEDL